jgi:hypothetical protein
MVLKRNSSASPSLWPYSFRSICSLSMRVRLSSSAQEGLFSSCLGSILLDFTMGLRPDKGCRGLAYGLMGWAGSHRSGPGPSSSGREPACTISRLAGGCSTALARRGMSTRNCLKVGRRVWRAWLRLAGRLTPLLALGRALSWVQRTDGLCVLARAEVRVRRHAQ